MVGGKICLCLVQNPRLKLKEYLCLVRSPRLRLKLTLQGSYFVYRRFDSTGDFCLSCTRPKIEADSTEDKRKRQVVILQERYLAYSTTNNFESNEKILCIISEGL